MTPALQLATLLESNASGRLTRKRQPSGGRPPLLKLIRSTTSVAWAIRDDVSHSLTAVLEALLRDEPPLVDFRDPPKHVDRYRELGNPNSGPAFMFPDALSSTTEVVEVTDERALDVNFRGWVPGEIAAGCAPVMAIVTDGHPVSVCFCARRTDAAAEAGLETASAYRGRGYAARVTTAWAQAIRASGRVPLYSTSWTNTESLAVARKLGLVMYAADFGIE